MQILLHHSSESGAGRSAEVDAGPAAEHHLADFPPLLPQPELPTTLQYNQLRHFDPTPGRWLTEDPVA